MPTVSSTLKEPSYLNKILALFICLMVTFITFQHVQVYQFTDWDDPYYVTDNADVKEFNLKNFFSQTYIKLYTPLTLISYAMEYKFFGESSKAFHTTNLILHSINVFLVWLISYKLLRISIPALLVALVFAIHPLQVEPVCWISSRKDLLFSFFLLLTFLTYIRLNEKNAKLNLIVTLLFFLFACLSKPTAFIFPVILIAYDFILRKEHWKRLIVRMIPFGLISLATFGFGSYLLLKEGVSIEYKSGFTLFQNISLAAYSLAFYSIKFFLPAGLSNFHAYPLAGPQALDWQHLISPVILIVLLGLIAFAIKKKRDLIGFGLLFFLVMLLPTFKLYPTGYPVVAERYSYLAIFGLMLGISAIVAPFLNFRNGRSMFFCATIIFLTIFLSFRTSDYSKTWKNSIQIWTNAIKQYPNHLQAYEHLARLNMKQGNKEAALSDFLNIIRIDPQNSDALNSSGNLLFELGKKEEGFKVLQEAVKTGTTESLPYYNLANLYKEKAEFNKAIQYYSMAIERKVNFHEAINNRGVCYILSGDTLSAFEDFKLAVQLSPADSMYINNEIRTRALIKK